MLLKAILVVGILTASGSILAEANYSLACSMSGSTARVFACNSGTTSEGNNHYVTVNACNGSDCDDDYDLMYIYSAAGGCEEVGTIPFDEPKEYCVANFRP